MKNYRLTIRLFALYNIFYSTQFVYYAETLLTSSGFQYSALFGSSEHEIFFARLIATSRLIASILVLAWPSSASSSIAFFITNTIFYFFAPAVSLAFISVFHCSLVIIFANYGIKNRSKLLVSKALTHALVSIQLLHFSSGVAKLFFGGDEWRAGSALANYLQYTAWGREWTPVLAHNIPMSILIALNYIVLFFEAASGFIFSRKFSFLLCYFYLFLHLGNLAILSIEEISLMMICHVLIIRSLHFWLKST